MTIINWTVEWQLAANSSVSGSVEVADDATAEEISAVVLDEIQNVVSWGWEKQA